MDDVKDQRKPHARSSLVRPVVTMHFTKHYGRKQSVSAKTQSLPGHRSLWKLHVNELQLNGEVAYNWKDVYGLEETLHEFVCVAHVFPAENSKMWIRTRGGCSTPCLLCNTEQPFRAEMISQPIITRVCGVYPKVSLL